MSDASLTLYQAEWCPFSSAVREVLTELGIDYTLRQVEPWPEQRDRLRELSGSDRIPILQTGDGRFLRGTREIFGYLREQEPWQFAAAHRRRFEDHADARESDAVAQLVDFFRTQDEIDATPETPADAVVVQVPEQSRYELRLDGRVVGVLAYHRRPGRVAFTHTNVARACEGRGFASRMVAQALEDARREGLEVAPLCPFVRHYIDKHPEYQALVASGHRRSPRIRPA